MGLLEPRGVGEDPDELGFVLSRSSAQDDIQDAFEMGGPEWPLSARVRACISAAAARPAGSPQAEQCRRDAGYSWSIDPGWG